MAVPGTVPGVGIAGHGVIRQGAVAERIVGYPVA
jgi:hypothetical protein